MSSIWHLGKPDYQRFPSLSGELAVDVIVIGGGITGLATGLRLVEDGKSVAILEAGSVGESSTGGSTGNLYATTSSGLHAIRRKWDDATVAEFVRCRAAALDSVESRIQRYGLKCDFARRPLHFCTAGLEENTSMPLDEEYDASLAGGLSARIIEDVPGFPAPVRRALRIENQAQYNPLWYAKALAEAASKQGCQIFEASPVTDVDFRRNQVSTDAGAVTAEFIVFATHTPKGVNLLQAQMETLREHGIAAPLQDKIPDGIFWLFDGFHSVRTYRSGGQDYLVVVGEKHKTGQGGADHHDNLERYARANFVVSGATHRWSAQQYRSSDLLPYIGRGGHENVLHGTGYAADGLIWGEVAADIFRDLINGRDNPYADLFNPRRVTPAKSAREWASVNMEVAKHLTSEYLKLPEVQDLSSIGQGDGAVVDYGGKKIAVYRREDGGFATYSAVCPHLKCVIKWNAADKSFDCPCHGSRFGIDGEVLEGPAYSPLKRVEV